MSLYLKKKKSKGMSKNIEQNRDKILKSIHYLVFNLKRNNFKQNNILCPTVLEKSEGWKRMKEKSDEIGYCCFTPEER